jgi:hypothetical protein
MIHSQNDSKRYDIDAGLLVMLTHHANVGKEQRREEKKRHMSALLPVILNASKSLRNSSDALEDKANVWLRGTWTKRSGKKRSIQRSM